MGKAMELSGKTIAMILTALGMGSVIPFLVKRWFRRDGRQENTDYWYKEFQRVMARVDDLENKVNSMEETLAKAQSEALFWRGQFYDEALSHKETKHSVSERLLSLKKQGRVDLDDIEKIYDAISERA